MMISSNALSLFLLEHNQNGFCNCTLCSIQRLMSLDESDGAKFKRVCTDFPNIVILTNRATLSKIQVTFGHSPIGNKSLGETVSAFSLAVSSESLMVVYINIKRTFTRACDNIRLLITEIILCTAFGNLARSKNLHGLVLPNFVLILSLLSNGVVLDGQVSASELLKIFSTKTS